MRAQGGSILAVLLGQRPRVTPNLFARAPGADWLLKPRVNEQLLMAEEEVPSGLALVATAFAARAGVVTHNFLPWLWGQSRAKRF